jgi:RNA polymerase sigma-70 factor (sigma-E family)
MRDEEFAAYVEQRRPQLFRAAWLLCGDAHRAEDVVQAALTRLYVAWPRVRRADSVDAYVRRAVVNAHLDEGRRPWRREQAVGERLPDVPVPAAASAVEERDALWTALRALPPGQRRVVVLRHWWGLSVDETAADLGISTGTVKSQTSAALAALRTALSDLSDALEENRS